jgi:tetratricopeptide (TPR) repeat protein
LIKLSFGEIYGHSANTLAATFVEHYDNIAESFPPLIENASNYPVDYQDVNALCNVALLWKKMNNLERAEEAIDRAILRVGSWMEAVVNQTNSMFFDSEVDCDFIDAEIYDAYFAIKSQLGRVDECKKMAPQAKLLAEKTGLEDLLATANSYL